MYAYAYTVYVCSGVRPVISALVPVPANATVPAPIVSPAEYATPSVGAVTLLPLGTTTSSVFIELLSPLAAVYDPAVHVTLAFRLPTVPAVRLPACPVGSVASVQKSYVPPAGPYA